MKPLYSKDLLAKLKLQTGASACLLSLKIRTRHYQKYTLLKVEENRKNYTGDNLLKAWTFTILRAIFIPDFYYGEHINKRHLRKIAGEWKKEEREYNIETLTQGTYVPHIFKSFNTHCGHRNPPETGKAKPHS